MFPVLCLSVLCAFLGCLGLFALAVTKVVAPDGRGHARGFGGGCAAVLALFLLCSLGLAGLAATVAAIGLGSVSSWNPIRHIEISRTRDEGPRDDSSREEGAHEPGAVSARFTVRGDADAELIQLLHGLVDPDERGDGLTVERRTGPDGAEFSVYEFRLPVSESELARFESDLRTEVDGLKLRLPERVDIDFEDAR